MSALLKSITDLRHPLYDLLEHTWATNERRYHAGVDATYDLTPFKWEEGGYSVQGEEAAQRALASHTGLQTGSRTGSPADGFEARRSRAVFPDYQHEFGERLCGEAWAKAPEPVGAGDEASGAEGTITFGALGEVGEDKQGNPTRAKMLWDNADGVGPDARSWDAFWYDEAAAATATGYRWVYVETPGRAANMQAEIDGVRPYLQGFSPLDVPYWRESAGRLDCAVIALPERRLVLSADGVKEEDATVYHVLVRAGFDGFGDELKAGGWWVVDGDGEVLTGDDGKERRGDWKQTGGDIPLGRLYYERPAKTGARGRAPNGRPMPAGLRAGTYTLGAIAHEVMDLNSAAFHDLWTSAKRQRHIGVFDAATATLLAERSADPIVYVPLPEGGRLDVHDSAETTANAQLVTERASLVEQAQRFITRELATAPDASGRAREMEHAKGTSPRLASLARNVEEAQNFCLRMLELRWTGRSDGARATWTKRFDLESAAKAMLPLVEALTSANLPSPTVVGDYVIASLRETGVDFTSLAGKEKEAQIRAELSVGYERDSLSLAADRDGLAQSPDPEARARGIAAASGTIPEPTPEA